MAGATKPTGLGHLRQLDGLRAIAILLVFVAHCGLDRIVPGGLGVTIFFFLSGYLITSLLRSEAGQTGTVDLGAFYLRRTIRIWPPLYITLALTLPLTLWWLPEQAVDPLAVLAQLGFVSNYAYLWGHADGVQSLPLWSLAVEEHFYLVFPLIYAATLRHMAPRRAAAWCAAACVGVLAVRFVCVGLYGPAGIIYYWSHTRIDSILFGSCLALWHNPVLDKDAWRPNRWHFATAIGVMLLCLVVRDPYFRQTLRYSLQGAALFVIFSYALFDRGWVARLLSSAPLRLISLYSYTFYLIHFFVIQAINRYWPGLSIPMLMLASGAATMAYCVPMYALVEAPLARWRRSLHKVDRRATLVGFRIAAH